MRWETISQHPNFEVSKDGKVRNKETKEELKQVFNLVFFDKGVFVNVARLVLDAFKPEWLGRQVYWKNGDMTDCRLANLKLGKPIKVNGNIKNFREVVRLTMDNKVVAVYPTVKSVGLSASLIIKCCRGKKEDYLGFKWMYLDDYEKKILGGK